jgi:hypothetical protein
MIGWRNTNQWAKKGKKTKTKTKTKTQHNFFFGGNSAIFMM